MEKTYRISEISFDQDNLVMNLNDQKYTFRIEEVSDKLAKADEKERNNYRISPSGYGIHWPDLDEDLSITGLLNLFKQRHVT